jgi:hypothetical protein
VANAVHVTARLLEENLIERISGDLAHFGADNLRNGHGAKGASE